MPSRRALLTGLASAGLASAAGCLGGFAAPDGRSPATSSTARTTSTITSETTTTVDPTERFSGPSATLPEGPKEPPERPDPLTADSVETYVRTFEEAWVYNEHYREDAIDITVSANVVEVFDLDPGFAAGVQSGGHMEYGDREETTVHADFHGIGPMTYLVDPDTTLRKSGVPCSNVEVESEYCED